MCQPKLAWSSSTPKFNLIYQKASQSHDQNSFSGWEKQIWSLGDFLVTTPTNGHLGSISVLEPTQQKILT